jgi:transketolase C-terminal domain/subunit
VDRILKAGRPAYVRIPKGAFKTPVSGDDIVKLPGKKDDVLLVSYGTTAQNCLEVQKLDENVSVLIVNKLRPLDPRDVLAALAPHARIFVIEDHFPSAGLYGSLCEFIAEHPVRGRVFSLAPRGYTLDVGQSSDYFYRKYGLDPAGIQKAIG